MTYEFFCPAGHKHEIRSSVADRDAPRKCSTEIAQINFPVAYIVPCGLPLTRVPISLGAGYFPGADSWRKT